ncbi:sulfite exporter TauE/SafE family protein [archaeon]|jgi:uncharacterized protein|nr:sulfite exporter TauE/SafE family protein [archaeon]
MTQDKISPSKKNKVFKVYGMHCNSCSILIEESLEARVNSVKANYAKGEVTVNFDEKKISEKEIIRIIEKGDFAVVNDKKTKIVSEREPLSLSDKVGFVVMAASLVLFFGMIWWLFGRNITLPEANFEGGSLFLLFIAGLLTGFHCISMCGGFVVSYTAKNAISGHKGFKQHLIYGGAKTISYSLIGGLFGLIGGIISFSIGLRATISILAGLFMVLYGLGMIGIKALRIFQFNFKSVTKMTMKASMSAKGPYRAPLVIGLLSGLFIACGPLQAMYIYAMGSGGFFNGFLALFAFGLGTLPMLTLFGGITTLISHNTTKKILKFSAIIVLILGIIMINRGLTVLGSPYSYDAIKQNIVGVSSISSDSVVLKDGVQEVYMTVDRYGWSPDKFVLKKGVPVVWKIDVKELTGCNNEIIVRDYDLDVKLKKGMNIVEFTPDKVETVFWSCWMGMIPGSFIITDDGFATESELSSAQPIATGSCGGGSTCGGTGSCGGGCGGGCGA